MIFSGYQAQSLPSMAFGENHGLANGFYGIPDCIAEWRMVVRNIANVDLNNKQDRHFVTALARGLAVLNAFRSGETWLAIHEIAERCKLPRSTVSRLTHTLTKLGYLHYGEERAKYRHGSPLLALSSVALGGLNVRNIAGPTMRDIVSSSGAKVGLGVRDNLSMRYIELLLPLKFRTLSPGLTAH